MIKTLHATLTVTFFVFSIFVSDLSLDLAVAQHTVAGSAVTRRPADPLQRALGHPIDRYRYLFHRLPQSTESCGYPS